MPSFARRAGIAFFDTLIDPLSYAAPGTHISGHAYFRAGHAYFPGHAYFSGSGTREKCGGVEAHRILKSLMC